jgi:hypothetical protein
MNYRPQIFAFVFGAFAALASPAAHAQVSINAQFGHPAWGLLPRLVLSTTMCPKLMATTT